MNHYKCPPPQQYITTIEADSLDSPVNTNVEKYFSLK